MACLIFAGVMLMFCSAVVLTHKYGTSEDVRETMLFRWLNPQNARVDALAKHLGKEIIEIPRHYEVRDVVKK